MPGFFPFVMPWDSAPNGSAADVSFLNHKPAGKHGRVVAKGPQFVLSGTGERIKFFGTNVGSRAAFPEKADADKIAARMAKLGINIVRFHHLNNGWDTEIGTIWKQGQLHVEIDPKMVDKLDYFVAALKKQGIYTNLNLQTSREMVPELGFPDAVRQIPNFQKKVDKVNRRMIELQKQYAKDLLDRVNPYTGIKYKDDPAVMVIEINNENSLAGWPGEAPGAGVTAWPEPFRGEMKGLWNNWLVKRYGSDAKLREAWPTSRNLTGASQFSNRSNWTNENQSNGNVTFQQLSGTGGPETSPGFVATVVSNPGPDWHVQAHLPGITFGNGKNYTLSFRVKADRVLAFNVDARLGVPDWSNLGLSSSVQATTEWKKHEISFKALGNKPGTGRISFVLGATRGKVEFADVSLREGTVSIGLEDGESAVAGNIDFPAPSASQRFRDWSQFIVDTESAYSNEMRAYLRDTLGFKETNIIDTQIFWGGMTGPTRESAMEFADNHAYWNHPTFLGADWSPTDYRVDRKAMVNEMRGKWGEFNSLTACRLADKPYSVSEYNHPAPSDFQVEMMPIYGSFAAFQDWDIIYTFAWDDTGSRADNSRYDNYFDVSKNPAKAAFFPATALMFRAGAFPAAGGSQVLTVPPKAWEMATTQTQMWETYGQDRSPLEFRIGMKVGTASGTSLKTEGMASKNFVISGEPGRQILVGAGPKAVMVNGFVGEQTVVAEGHRFLFGRTGSEGFAAMTLTPLDGQPLQSSKRILLTLGARVENLGMQWNAERNSVRDQWGRGPVHAEFVPLTAQLSVDGVRKVYPLNPDGTRRAALSASFENGRLRFATDPGNPSMWLEIVVP